MSRRGVAPTLCFAPDRSKIERGSRRRAAGRAVPRQRRVRSCCAGPRRRCLISRSIMRILLIGGTGSIGPELEWSRAIARTMQWDGEFVVLPDAALPAHSRAAGNTAQHWVADTAKIRRELGVGETI